MTPLAIDLFCGLGGWTEGLLAEGYRVIGFDIERHRYGSAQYPGQLVLQDVLTLDGAQFRHAALIVASPPCQAYSYRAMPWSRAKALPPPDNTLFEACFRIQREASAAAGRYIPLVVENVCGAQKWVGRARWHYGSFYLWGDVPALMPIVRKSLKNQTGGSWFPQGNGASVENNHGRDRLVKVEGFRFDGSGRSFQSAAVKVAGLNWSNYGKPGYKAEAFNTTAEQRLRDGVKDRDADGYVRTHPDAFGWKIPRTTSKGLARKAASASIAKIPLPLARHIAAAWHPVTERAACGM